MSRKMSKGKEKASVKRSRSPSPSATPELVIKRSRSKAETRDCPICHEPIPLRLLAKHAELESSRVQDIIDSVGDLDPFQDEFEEGPSTTTRRSATKARRSILQTTHPIVASRTPVLQTIAAVKRNRKSRHARLRDMTKEDEDYPISSTRAEDGRNEVVCPVCLNIVYGDQDVLDAHVDACLAHEARLEQERQTIAQIQAQAEEEEIMVDIDGDPVGGYIGDVRGTGFHTRNPDSQDVDDEVDVDGDDAVLYGVSQFTETDVLPLNPEPTSSPSQRPVPLPLPPPAHSDIGIDLDAVIIQAKSTSQDPQRLINALESKIRQLKSTRLSCRICIDPYVEPTVSTGCWHTCCRECWLRCLGSTKLCPICKRITAPTDLRRVYL
ncbi:ring finger protein 1 [Moniliophthora roreri]|nr:ring finger protein 1 [Moniliophthora roreri]